MDFSRAYETLVLFQAGPLADSSAAITCESYGARFQLDHDLSPLFPYLNAVADRAYFFEKTCLHQINSKEAHIKGLQLRLASFEKERIANIDEANSALPTPLTKREIEVLRLITQGATNKEIAADLKISQHTVKSHVIHIFNKIAVNDRAQASVWGARQGIL